MRVSWVLFCLMTAILWTLWPRLPLLPGVAHCTASLLMMACASYFLAKSIWRVAFVRLVSPDGKAVLITGCDTGFGHLLAQFLARDGFLVFAGCLDANGQGATALKKLSRIKVIQMDVTKEYEIEDAYRIITEEMGTLKLWAVVANAGMMTSGLIEWMTMASITRIFDVNVFGVVRVVKKFLPLLRKSRGRAVIVASNLSYFTLPFTTPYAMTKHAVLSFIDGLRRECYGKGVDVVAIEPHLYRSKVTDAVGCASAVHKELETQGGEVTAHYSTQEIDDWITSSRALFEFGMKDDISDIVNQMVLAVRETDPKTCYDATGLFDSAWLSALKTLPAEAVDLILLWSRRIALRRKTIYQ
ncbi:retinol dehydrogenase 7-like isoform X2 [Haemaphysalis longicornis]